MEFRIVTEPSSKIKEIARNVLSGKWKQVFYGLVVYYLLTTGVSSILDFVFSATQTINGATFTIPYGSSLYDFLVGGPLVFGISLFMLMFFRCRETNSSLVLEGFSHFGKAFLIYLITAIKTFLWVMLFVIPGIIAALNYSQAYFVMADHPEYSANQCIEESKKIMKGNKMGLFLLTLSFIGWIILGSVFSAFALAFVAEGLTGIIISIVVGIPLLIIDVYMMTAQVGFYELATNRLVVIDEESYEE